MLSLPFGENPWLFQTLFIKYFAHLISHLLGPHFICRPLVFRYFLSFHEFYFSCYFFSTDFFFLLVYMLFSLIFDCFLFCFQFFCFLFFFVSSNFIKSSLHCSILLSSVTAAFFFLCFPLFFLSSYFVLQSVCIYYFQIIVFSRLIFSPIPQSFFRIFLQLFTFLIKPVLSSFPSVIVMCFYCFLPAWIEFFTISFISHINIKFFLSSLFSYFIIPFSF